MNPSESKQKASALGWTNPATEQPGASCLRATLLKVLSDVEDTTLAMRQQCPWQAKKLLHPRLHNQEGI